MTSAWTYSNNIARLTIGRAEVVAGNFTAISNAFSTIDGQFTSVQGQFTALNAAKLSLTGGTMTGSIAMSGYGITGLVNPTSPQDAATKYYVDATAFNSNLPGQAGNAGKYITTNGTSASWGLITYATVQPFLSVSTDTTAASNTRYIVDSSAAIVNITLPVAPVNGDEISIARRGYYAVNVLPNGKTISGSTGTLTIDIAGADLTFTYNSGVWNMKMGFSS